LGEAVASCFQKELVEGNAQFFLHRGRLRGLGPVPWLYGFAELGATVFSYRPAKKKPLRGQTCRRNSTRGWPAQLAFHNM